MRCVIIAINNKQPACRRLLAVMLAVFCGAGSVHAAAPMAVEPASPPPSPAVQTLLDEANRLGSGKQPREALDAADRALEAARASGDPAGAARAQRMRGLALQDLGQVERAAAAWQEASVAWERAGDGPGRVEALARAGLLLATSRPKEADTLLARTVVLAREETQRPLASARMLSIAAQAAYAGQLLEQAHRLGETALAILEPRMPGSGDLATVLTNLGTVAHDQGKLAVARNCHQRALEIWMVQAPKSTSHTNSLLCLGRIARDQGDYDAARQYYEAVVRIRGALTPRSPAVAAGLTALADLATHQGDFARVEAYLRQALEIHQAGTNANSLEAAATLSQLGRLEYARKQWASAEEYARRALEIAERHAPHSLHAASSLHDLGRIAHARGDLAAAETRFRDALAIQEKLAPESLAVAASLHGLGMVAQKQGNWTEAERRARAAWELVRRQAAAVAGDEPLQAFGTAAAPYAAALLRAQIALGQTDVAFLTLEEGRAQALQQILLDRSPNREAGLDPLWSHYREQLARRDQAEQVAERAIAGRENTRRAEAAAREQVAVPDAATRAGSGAGTAAAWEYGQGFYVRARMRADQAWTELQQRARRASTAPLTPRQAQQALGPGVLLASFSVGEEQSHLFLVRAPGAGPSSLTVHTVAVTSGELTAHVRKLRSLVVDPLAEEKETAPVGRALFAMLFPPETRKAVQEARRLVISPDGPVWDVPFAALVTNHAGPAKYLGLEKAITYTPSLTLLAQGRQGTPRLAAGSRPYVLAVGNPLFERPADRQTIASAPPHGTRDSTGERGDFLGSAGPLRPLPETQAEAEQIAALYGGKLLTREGATESAVRAELAKADVIHLATHGRWYPVRAMSSGVLLTPPAAAAGSKSTDDDGVLQAWEVYSQTKLRAELVVLSACETGRGENVRGEGIVGLTRALQVAGARAIVATRWQVADRSSRTLTVTFHQRLRAGIPKDEALRQAMAAVSQDSRTAHPYHWAAFFLVGDPENANLGERSEPWRPQH